MHHRVDPVLLQYRTVSSCEIDTARQALLLGEDADALRQVGDCLGRIDDMATMLRHRRTTRLVRSLQQVTETATMLGSGTWDRALDALERLVQGGRPDPRIVEEIESRLSHSATSGMTPLR